MLFLTFHIYIPISRAAYISLATIYENIYRYISTCFYARNTRDSAKAPKDPSKIIAPVWSSSWCSADGSLRWWRTPCGCAVWYGMVLEMCADVVFVRFYFLLSEYKGDVMCVCAATMVLIDVGVNGDLETKSPVMLKKC